MTGHTQIRLFLLAEKHRQDQVTACLQNVSAHANFTKVESEYMSFIRPRRQLAKNYRANIVFNGLCQKKGPAVPQSAGPLTILGVLFLSEVAYSARASISYGLTARL